MHTRALALLMSGAVVGCSGDPSSLPPNHNQPIHVTTTTSWHKPSAGGHVPRMSGGAHPPGMLFMTGGGDFTFIGDIVPGTASFDAAPVIAPDDPGTTTTGGGGAFDVTVGGTEYVSTTPMTLAAVFPDDAGTDYLVLAGMAEDTDPLGVVNARVVYALVKASDFAPGATVALDGVDRVAMFGAGPESDPDPTVVGAAVTGTVTFTSGSTAVGDTITATLEGDFGEIDWTAPPPPPPPGGGSITAGTYAMTVTAMTGGGTVYCDGAALAGHESDFAGIATGDVGFADGSVTIGTPDPASLTLDGASLASGFGSSSLTLAVGTSPMDPPGLYAVNATRTGAGPLGTSLVEADLALDGGSASPSDIRGFADAVYQSSDGSSYCAVGFDVLLTAGP